MNALAAEPILDGRYVLLEAIGRGGMGRVYRAFDRETERPVALKVLHGVSGRGPSSPLTEEFAAWARLRHPNIVRAHALGFAAKGPLPSGTPYLVLEHVPGAPVHRALVPGGEDPACIESVARQVLEALAHIHDTGWVHRDLKPGNVLARTPVRGDPRVKLTDFGLAASAGTSRAPGRVSGSLPYVAPEAILGGRIDGRGDLYALGILLFYLICARLPFDARRAEEVVRWHLEGPPADPRAVRPEFPDRLARLVARLTSRDPEVRPADAREALAALGGLERRGSAAGPPPMMRRGAVASLRLAFDAARVGAWRVLDLPADRAGAEALAAEACVLAQVHGAALLRLRSARDGGRGDLGRAVLQLLLARGAAARDLARRHELETRFPLGFFGGLPLWDRMRAERGGLDDVGALETTARGIAAFVAESIGPAASVLVVDRGALRDPLAGAVIARIRAEAVRRSAPNPSGRGLLIVAPTSECSIDRAAPPRRRATAP